MRSEFKFMWNLTNTKGEHTVDTKITLMDMTFMSRI